MVRRSGTDSAERIVEAAIDLFSLKGYNATSLREVAGACGLKVGSLYNHISSKEQLLFDIMTGIMTELLEDTRAAMEAEQDPVARIRAFLRTSIHLHATRRKQALLGSSELRSLSDARRRQIVDLRDQYEELLAEALRAAAHRDLVVVDDIQLATFSAIALCTSVAGWYRPDGRLSLEELQERIPSLFAPLARAECRAEPSVGAPSPR